MEHAQGDPENPFESFVRVLKTDQQRLDQLESDIASMLRRLSTIELGRTHRIRDVIFMASEVDHLPRAAHRIHELCDGIEPVSRPTDVAIEIARSSDGSVIVFPALPA